MNEQYKQAYIKVQRDRQKLMKQNKCYREAIEKAIDKLTWNSVESEKILLKALEELE